MTPDQVQTLARLAHKLASLGVDGEFLPTVSEGPVITLYRFVPKNATRVASVERLAPDLAVALGAEAVQVNRLPGENAVGIFVPNKVKHSLEFKDSVTEVWKSYNDPLTNLATHQKLPICLGQDHMGRLVVEDLTSLPHLLIAGSTGGGKSTLLNSIIASFIYCIPSTDLKLVLCDPKQVEFNHFEAAPHLLMPIATSTRDILDALKDLVRDVETRLSMMAKYRCQNIAQFHALGHKLPYVVVVIDELADPLQDQTTELIVDPVDGREKKSKPYGKQAEFALGKIASKARATGIHIIGATQRPSVRVVEGNIKANFPARLSFRLPSEMDSRTILNQGGAEHLLSQGDALYLSPNSPAVRRIHAPLAIKSDIEAAIEMALMKERSIQS